MSTDSPTADESMTETDPDRLPLDANGEVTLPIVEVLTGRAFLTGKSGAGKSNSASVVAEELLDRGYPILIVDTDGEYWGLKEEYEILHVGADEECDLQVSPEHAPKLAELALEDNIPIILDVSGFLEKEAGDALVRETAKELFQREKKLKKPFLMLVEEIHEYIPEGGGVDDTGRWLIRIAKRGRKRGLGLAGMSQRPANVKKDFITQCDWLLWHRLTWDNDTKVVKRVVGSDYQNPVQELADGEAFLMADFLEADVQRVQVRRKHTFDAGATPTLENIERPDLKTVSADLVGELEEISEREERRQDRIAQLEARLEEKDDRIEELEDELQEARDMSDMAREFTAALTSTANGQQGEELQATVDEIREEKNAEIRRLRDENEELSEKIDALREERDELRERVSELEQYEQAVSNMDDLREGVRRMADALGIDAGADDETLKRKLQKKDERIAELEDAIEELREVGYTLDSEYTEKIDFLKADPVQDAIETAAGKTRTKAPHTWDVLSVLVDRDKATTEDIVPFTDISESSVRSIISKLKEQNVVVAEKRGKTPYYSLNIDGMKELIQQQKKREQMDELKQQVRQT